MSTKEEINTNETLNKVNEKLNELKENEVVNDENEVVNDENDTVNESSSERSNSSDELNESSNKDEKVNTEHLSFKQFQENQLMAERKNNIEYLWKKINMESINFKVMIKILNKYEKYKNVLADNDIKNIDEYVDYLRQSKLNILGLELEPNRQSIDERLQLEYLNTRTKNKIKKLSIAKLLCIRSDTFEIVAPKEVNNKLLSKNKFDAIDKGETLYILKHIRDYGNTQETQLNEVANHLKLCVEYNKKFGGRSFKVVVSGDYAVKNVDKLKDIAKNDKYIEVVALE